MAIPHYHTSYSKCRGPTGSSPSEVTWSMPLTVTYKQSRSQLRHKQPAKEKR
jgi:hypothetical protein